MGDDVTLRFAGSKGKPGKLEWHGCHLSPVNFASSELKLSSKVKPETNKPTNQLTNHQPTETLSAKKSDGPCKSAVKNKRDYLRKGKCFALTINSFH